MMFKTTFKQLLDRRDNAHKYDFGHILVVGGSPGMVGAPFLAGQAAMRAGAGLVTIASSAAVVDKLEKRVAEIMTLRLPEKNAAGELFEFIKKRKVLAVVVGPGLNEKSAPLVKKLLTRLTLPMVVDGGAIGVLAGDKAALQKITKDNEDIIFTPHAGEYEKLTGEKPSRGIKARTQAVKNFAHAIKTTVVLKGQPTLVAHPDGTVYQNNTGGPGMATAGTGDVLSGIIAALIGQGIAPAQAVEAGVYLHGLAGNLAVKAKTQAGTVASDVIENIPAALKQLS